MPKQSKLPSQQISFNPPSAGKSGTRMIQVKNEAEKYLSEDVTIHPDNEGLNALQYWKVSIILGLCGFIYIYFNI